MAASMCLFIPCVCAGDRVVLDVRAGCRAGPFATSRDRTGYGLC